jgi:hypothetical protein
MKVIDIFYHPQSLDDPKGSTGIVVDCREPITPDNWITDGKLVWQVDSVEDAWVLAGEVKEKSLLLKGEGEPRVGAKITRIFDTTLWRPVGPEELELIKESNYNAFPYRLPGQSYFYPVCNFEYACEITQKWNVKDSGVGYVTKFQVRNDFLENYQTHTVGGRTHQEYWIPAEMVHSFNKAILGKIKIVAEYS